MADQVPSGEQPEPTEPVREDAPEHQPAETPSQEPPPWGDDFEPSRAWNTIQTQRARERELEGQVRELQSSQTDPDRKQQLFRELADEFGYELDDGDTEEYEPEYEQPEGPVEDPRFTEYLQRQELEKLAGQVVGHIDDLAKERGVTLTDRQRDAIFRDAVSGEEVNQDVTERVFGEWVEDIAADRKRDREDYLSSKRGTRTPPQGQPGEQEVDLSDDNARLDVAEAAAAAAMNEGG